MNSLVHAKCQNNLVDVEGKGGQGQSLCYGCRGLDQPGRRWYGERVVHGVGVVIVVAGKEQRRVVSVASVASIASRTRGSVELIINESGGEAAITEVYE